MPDESLGCGDFGDREIADAWTPEIDRRIAAYERGETAGLSVNEVLEYLRTRLAASRARGTIS